MRDSIVVRLKPGLSREDADDSSTIHVGWTHGGRRAFRDLFLENYESIRSSREALTGPGVTMTAIGPAGFEGAAAISARPDAINVLTVGRHSHAHLFLSGEKTLSLRQGALIVHPCAAGENVRFRLLDLRAACPFEDEQGRPFEALEADGPVFLHVGGYSLFLFPKGADSAPWSGSPEQVWEEIPHRAYLEEVVIERADERFRGRSGGTLALSLPGPSLDRERLLEEGESPRSQLVVRSAEGEMTLELGRSAAARGVLLGRYPRCDGSRFAILSNAAISRVHVLLIEIAGKLYALDAGSKNGLWSRGVRVPLASLGTGSSVGLAGAVATLEWRFLH
jgi:hypothetical protein